MKEYLGLGVVFSAVDKGLAKSLKLTSQGLSEVDEKMKKTGETASNAGKKGGILNGLYDGLKLLSLSQIGSTLNDIQDAMTGAGNSIEDTFLKLDTLQTKVALTFDGKQAQNLNKSLLDTMRLGLTGNELEMFGQSFMEFGRTVDEATKSLPMMGQLVGTMGLEADKVAKMYGQGLATLRATPDAISGIIKQVVATQKAYKLTDMVSDLPEIFESVTKNSAMFGKVNAQTALNTVRSISQLTAVFRKVGMSQQGALAAATGFGDKLASLKRSVADMRAGLEPLDNDLFDAAQTLTLMGFSGEDAFKKIEKGASDPAGLAKELNSVFLKLSEDQQNIVSARFRRIFGDEATNLLAGYGDEAKKAFDIKDKPEVKASSPDKIFDEYTKGLKSTVEVQKKLTESSEAYFKVMTSFVNKDKTIKVLQAQRTAWDDLSAAVTKTDSIFGKFLATLDLFQKHGLGGFILDLVPFGIMAGLLSGLIFPLANLVGLLKIFGKLPLKVIGGFFKGLSATLGTTGLGFKALLKPVMLFKTIAEHLYVSIGVRMIDAFAKLQKGLALLMRIGIGPLMTAFRTLAMVISLTPIGWVTGLLIGLGAALAGIIYYWDDISKFFSDVGSKASQMADELASSLGLDEVWKSMKTGFADAVKYITELWNSFTKWMSESVSLGGVGKALGKIFGLGSDEKKNETVPSPASVATEQQASVIPLKQQPGVAAMPTYTSFADQKTEQVSDPNIQALLNEISKLGQFIAQMGQALSDRPVQVSIEGDVKKFFKAVNQEQKNQVGQRMAGGAF